MKTIRWLLFAAIIPLSGCLGLLAEHRENAKMASWEGTDIQRVVVEWEPPTSRYGNVYEWVWNGQAHATAMNGEVTAWQDSCREWFEVAGDRRILSWHWHGHCY